MSGHFLEIQMRIPVLLDERSGSLGPPRWRLLTTAPVFTALSAYSARRVRRG